MKSLKADPDERYATAREMARALEKIGSLVPASDIGEWVEKCAGDALAGRASTIAKIEASSGSSIRVAALVDAIKATRESNPDVPVLAPEEPLGSETDLDSERFGLPKRPPWLLYVVLSAAVAVVGGTLGVMRLRARAAEANAAVAAPHTAAPATATAQAGDPGPTTPSAALSFAVPAPAPASAIANANTNASPNANATTTATAAVGAAQAHTPASSTTTARPAPPRPICDPPWYTDASGNRHYKRECLK
jgi:hypothetical protein